ncbi:hypothetical protein RRF57_013413 [Xylaria bambusicola]|uniref:Uncharacterized protein n=1 Tax=Xylaria bambusicola TaxID=326684 RepID=A0AAN7V0R7_9PEZI
MLSAPQSSKPSAFIFDLIIGLCVSVFILGKCKFDSNLPFFGADHILLKVPEEKGYGACTHA